MEATSSKTISQSGVAMSALWANIPRDLRRRKQWAICKTDKAPRGWNGELLKPTNLTGWMTFEEAVARAQEWNWYIGYLVTEDDEFTVIDIDIKDASNCADPLKWTTKNLYDFYWKILRTFNSYTEISLGGKGYHIWMKGKCRSGKKDGVEIYSKDHFIICTGNIAHNAPVNEQQELLSSLADHLFGDRNAEAEPLDEVEQIEDDMTLVNRILSSSSGHKFDTLASGRWEGFGYPSQSEADMSLMHILAEYSESNVQCRRIFRMTILGRREKAQRDDYLNRTLKQVRAKIRAERDLVAETDFTGLIANANAVISERTPPHTEASPFEAPPPLSTTVAISAPIPPIVADAPTDGMDWPPGFAGRVSQFFYSVSPRPVKEVAIVSMLGMLAGICGKAYAIPLSGLNLYVILVARSAIGKEAMHSSISILASHMAESCPHINNFLSFTDFVSGPALLKEVIQNPSICNIAGEWGQKLMHIAKGEDTAGPLATLRKEMTNLYQKSGANSIVGGLAYSDKDKNIASVTGVAYSMIGETTPDTFYAAVTPSMMADGFMSRFLTVEYKGERPPLNNIENVTPDQALVDSMVELANHAHEVIMSSSVIFVTRSQEAARILEAFEKECDAKINMTEDEAQRQMWNRASLKVLRVSALLAVADNDKIPVVKVEHALWSIKLVRHGIAMMEQRINTGDVGLSDGSREKKLITVIREYLFKRPPPGYRITDEMYQAKVITRMYLSQRIQKHAAFENHRMGSSKALDFTIEHLIQNGCLQALDKTDAYDKLKIRGRAYQILPPIMEI